MHGVDVMLPSPKQMRLKLSSVLDVLAQLCRQGGCNLQLVSLLLPEVIFVCVCTIWQFVWSIVLRGNDLVQRMQMACALFVWLCIRAGHAVAVLHPHSL